MKLLVSLLSGVLFLTAMGGQAALRSLDDYEFRQYEYGDDLTPVSGQFDPDDCNTVRCWVAVDTTKQKVVGVLVMSIPMSETSVPDDILFEILRNRPMSSKQWVGDIGAIHNLFVAKGWENNGVEEGLLSVTFEDLPSVQPNWDVLYLYANPTKRARVALYEKHKFIKILDKVEGDPVVYARYNA